VTDRRTPPGSRTRSIRAHDIRPLDRPPQATEAAFGRYITWYEVRLHDGPHGRCWVPHAAGAHLRRSLTAAIAASLQQAMLREGEAKVLAQLRSARGKRISQLWG